ncbi:mitochondrial carrier domain-containing protein [Hyaloraphidium curvatum]|nr:mitochondrial carrier domain-containing protein [Hyaloraphidium curvatum]
MAGKPKKSALEHLTGGAVSGLASCVLLQPLDLVKTRLQQEHPRKGTIVQTVKSIVRQSGLSGLWRGLTPTIIRNVPGTSMYFLTLNESRKLLNGLWKRTDLVKSSVRPDNFDNMVNLVAGGFSRAFVGFILMPVTVIKVRYESNLYNYNSMFDAGRSIIATDGARGLFAGFGATLVRDAPQAGLYVLIYEQSRGLLNQASGADGSNKITASLVNMTSGLIGGIVSTVMTQPFDMAKTRIQLEPGTYRNLIHALVKIVKDEGFNGYFAGTTPRILRKALSSALTWTLYSLWTSR